jgi:mono/diheme cytochrome c family protein
MRVLLLAAAFFACAPKTPESQGKALFVGMGCRTCHKIAGEGGTGGTDLTLVGFRRSREWLDLWIKDPKAWKPDTLMPQKQMSDQARAAIVEYLSGLKGQDWKRQTDGRVIFKVAGCTGCHGRGGSGGYPNNNVPGGKIPALTGVKDGYTLDELKALIRKGKVPQKLDPNGPEPMLRMPEWGTLLSEDEIDAVARYVMTFGKDAPASSEW